MKRLLAIGTVGFVIAAMICIELERRSSIICLAIVSFVLMLSVVLSLFCKRRFFKLTFILSMAVLSFLLFLFHHSLRVDNAHSYNGYNGKITAQITKLETNEYYSELTVNRAKIGDEEIGSRILVNLPEGNLAYKEGEYIILDGKLHTDFSSLFDYNEERYLASQNIFLLMDAESIKKANIAPNKFRGFVFDYKSKAVVQADTLEYGGFISTLALGDKSNLDAEIQADFQKLGLQHALAVSGMHLSLLVMSVYVFFQRYSVGKYPLSVICSLVTVFYMAITGFTFSIVRAGIMMIIYFISLLVRRPNDSVTTLFTSALFLLILNPWAVYDVGFQLSFFATLGILVLAKPMIERIENHTFFTKQLPKKKLYRFFAKTTKKCVKSIFVTFFVSISATLTTIPLALIYFNSITPLSIIANVTVIFLINIVLVVSVIYIMLTPVLIAPFNAIGAIICDSISYVTLSLTGILADAFPNPLYFSPEVSKAIAVACAFVLLLFFVFYKNHKTAIYAVIAYTITIILTLGILNSVNGNTAYITFSTSKSCRDTLIETSQGKTLLSYVEGDFSTYSMNRIIEYRKAYSLDTVVIFSDNASPLEKAEAILKKSKINKIILVKLNGSLKSRDKHELSKLAEVEYVKGGEFSIGENVSVRKVGKSYITVTVNQGDNDVVIVYTQDGKSVPSHVESAEGIVILGASEKCPRYYDKELYLCSLPKNLIKNKGASNSDKFSFGFIKLSDKSIDYRIY